MLSRLFEWYRMVDPEPSDDTITKRREAIGALLDTISNQQDDELLVSAIAATINGFDGVDQESPIVKATVSAIRNHQPAFPEDLSENALAVRACCTIALGEILDRDKEAQYDDALLVATLITSANGVRPAAKERYLRNAIEELESAARKVLEKAAQTRRRRNSIALDELDGLEATSLPGDVKDFWKVLYPTLKGVFVEIQEQATADREELQVLWWLYRGFSDTAQLKKLTELDSSAAALGCGAELGDIVVCPPAAGICQIVRRAAQEGRKKQDLIPRSLTHVASKWASSTLSALLPTQDIVTQLIQSHPTLLPLSWLSKRIHESGKDDVWEAEFRSKTGIPPDHACSPAEWAAQAFHEKIAQRVYQATNKG